MHIMGVQTLDEARRHMDSLHKEAESLYDAAIADGCRSMFKPALWLMHQDEMRQGWETFVSMMPVVEPNSFTRYMQFMYDSYPAGLGREAAAAAKEGREFDGAEAYLRLNAPKT